MPGLIPPRLGNDSATVTRRLLIRRPRTNPPEASESAVRHYFGVSDIMRQIDGEPEPDGGRMDGQVALPAGEFSAWAKEMSGALRGANDAEVPCGTCTACCTASQFIHIGPEETDTLAHIPADFLFPAPRSPRGHVLIGYDERGHCPMLVDEKCSIYEYRPKTCRTYDCRVFAAADVELEAAQYVRIERQVRRWRFTYSDPVGRLRHEAVEAAARYLRENAGLLPGVAATTAPARLAVLAFEIHDLFLLVDGKTSDRSGVPPELNEVRARLATLHTTTEL